MILAAMIHAGCPLKALQEAVRKLKLPGIELRAEPVERGGIAAMHVSVETDPGTQSEHRHLPEIVKLIVSADLPAIVAERVVTIFYRLAEAEAAAHGVAVDQVHFHEVGAVDALVDIVGACVGAELLGLKHIICSPIPPGQGTLTCAHGVMPVPAPATAELLKNVPLAVCEEQGELVTPTGAAILTTLSADFGVLPPMRIESIGYGAGTRMGRIRPNYMRLLVGELESEIHAGQDRVQVLEAQVDDSTGQAVAYACERLLAAGALDTYIVPIIMKKGRPGQLLTVLCRPDDAADLERILFAETSTLGVRRHETHRHVLARAHVTVTTRFGEIRVKIGRRGDQVVQAWPEYEDCSAMALKAGVPLNEVQQEALRSWKQCQDA